MIEVNKQFIESDTEIHTKTGGIVSITPPIGSSYFIARVPLFKDQAIQIFPKFFTIGCGFAQEEDWNTNLPLGCDAVKIYGHIRHNKKYSEITDEQCIAAIEELQGWWAEREKDEA
jgi:hypothetical protein